MLYFISLLFLTNFQLGEWVRALWDRRAAAQGEATPEEDALERRARDLQKQAQKLQDEVDRSGLGADMQPVPAPTVRDLSVPQPSKAARGKKPAQPEPAKEPAPADEGEVIPARELAAATTGGHSGQEVRARQASRGQSREAKADAAPPRKPTPGKRRPSPSPNRRCTFPACPPTPPRLPNPSSPGNPSPLPSPPRP